MRETQGDGSKQTQATGLMVNRKVQNIEINNCLFQNIIDLGRNNLSHAIYLQNIGEATITSCTFKMTNSISFENYWDGGVQVYGGENGKILIENNIFANTQSNLFNSDNTLL